VFPATDLPDLSIIPASVRERAGVRSCLLVAPEGERGSVQGWLRNSPTKSPEEGGPGSGKENTSRGQREQDKGGERECYFPCALGDGYEGAVRYCDGNSIAPLVIPWGAMGVSALWIINGKKHGR
jgi:hypothetical protein